MYNILNKKGGKTEKIVIVYLFWNRHTHADYKKSFKSYFSLLFMEI